MLLPASMRRSVSCVSGPQTWLAVRVTLVAPGQNLLLMLGLLSGLRCAPKEDVNVRKVRNVRWVFSHHNSQAVASSRSPSFWANAKVLSIQLCVFTSLCGQRLVQHIVATTSTFDMYKFAGQQIHTVPVRIEE